MKRFAIFLIPLLLAGCAFSAPREEAIPYTTQAVTEQTQPVTQTPTEEITEPCGEEIHSEFYIPGLDVEDVILYFNEVCLDAEFTNSGDPSVLQKWDRTIRFTVHGEPTAEDLQTLYGFLAWLDTIEGFPPIEDGDIAPKKVNLNIYFCSKEEMVDLLGSNFRRMDGGVTFWYQDNRIYNAIVCCRTDLDQHLRNSVILEELYNGLGPVQDTALRPDSIIYSEFSTPQELTEIDELILRLLYHPKMECGMTAQQCEEVIRALYY